MKMIWLTKGQFTLVDDEDFEYLSQWKWKATKIKNSYYATRSVHKKEGKFSTMFIHRIVLNVTDRNILIDHRDGNPLNNQKNNLRPANKSENAANQKARSGCTSKYLGVSWHKPLNKWKVNLQKDKVNRHIGYFASEQDAALAYNNAAKIFHGEFANLNIISDT